MLKSQKRERARECECELSGSHVTYFYSAEWQINKTSSQKGKKTKPNSIISIAINTAMGAHSIAQFDINSLWQFTLSFSLLLSKLCAVCFLCDMSCSILYGNRRHWCHLNFKCQIVCLILYCYGPELFVQGKKQQQQQLKDESMSYIIDGNVYVRILFVYTLSKQKCTDKIIR